MRITVETKINAPIETVWDAWNAPDDIGRWNAASDGWHTTRASVDLRVGGAMYSRMEAKDGSVGFDFAGIYTVVEHHKAIAFALDDSRTVKVEFDAGDDCVTVRETFDADESHSTDQQRDGWQAILNRFRDHVEAKVR